MEYVLTYTFLHFVVQYQKFREMLHREPLHHYMVDNNMHIFCF